ncbi:MAG: MEDS domain-containing protein [Thermoanaerobaculia bacterium]
MASELRPTGIDLLGEVPWGSHSCLFYETTEDLIDTLVPYFREGLDRDEFCLWVAFRPLDGRVARKVIEERIPGAARRLKEGDIEIVGHDEWYLGEGAFESRRVIHRWLKKLELALAKGYSGMRVSGNEAWLSKGNFSEFFEYERKLDVAIANRPILVLCAYPLTSTGAAEVFDVAQSHQFVAARKRGEWQLLEVPALRQAKAEIARLNEDLERRVAERTDQLAAANEALRSESRRLQRVSLRLLTAQELERRRVAMELHDELGQVLTAVKLSLQSLQRTYEEIEMGSLREAIESVDQALARVRELALDLRPSVLDDFGLAAALRWYADRFARESRLDVRLNTGDLPRLLPDLETACFRVAQAALINVVTHAKARHVWIDVRVSGDRLELRVRDDGSGFDVASALQRAMAGNSMGLLAMQERVSLLEGTFDVRSAPGQGTEVKALFPLRP